MHHLPSPFNDKSVKLTVHINTDDDMTAFLFTAKCLYKIYLMLFV